MIHKFNCIPLHMLFAALSVADHFETEKASFIAENPQWNDPFISNFRDEVNRVLQENYGINTHESVQKQTRLLNNMGDQAMADLRMIKTQIERGFRAVEGKTDAILDKLGFTMFWARAANSNMAMLSGLLLTFRNNLDAELEAELEQNGVNPSRIDNLLNLAGNLAQANVAQETMKGTAKIDTEKNMMILNDIYNRTMDICSIGQQLFRNDDLRKELFVFGRLVKQQKAMHPAGKKNDEKDNPSGATNQ